MEFSIGELARLSGLTVKAVRYYSDLGLVPPARRSPAGYRVYGAEAVARLGLVRTLRELGLGLSAIRAVADRDVPLAGIDPESAAADPVVAAVLAAWPAGGGRLLAHLEAAADPGRDRYFELLSVINGWQRPESLTPSLDWFVRALRARNPGSRTASA
jgi:DNA-binding transcriptional MerR regulator